MKICVSILGLGLSKSLIEQHPGQRGRTRFRNDKTFASQVVRWDRGGCPQNGFSVQCGSVRGLRQCQRSQVNLDTFCSANCESLILRCSGGSWQYPLFSLAPEDIVQYCTVQLIDATLVFNNKNCCEQGFIQRYPATSTSPVCQLSVRVVTDSLLVLGRFFGRKCEWRYNVYARGCSLQHVKGVTVLNNTWMT